MLKYSTLLPVRTWRTSDSSLYVCYLEHRCWTMLKYSALLPLRTSSLYVNSFKRNVAVFKGLKVPSHDLHACTGNTLVNIHVVLLDGQNTFRCKQVSVN